MRGSESRPSVLVRAVILLVAAGAGVVADGMFVPTQKLGDAGQPSSAAQKAIIIREGPDQVLLLQTTYAGPATEFAWIVPVPELPTDVFEADPYFMDMVFVRTNPHVVTKLTGPEEERWGSKSDATEGADDAEANGGGAWKGKAAVTVHARLERADENWTGGSATTALPPRPGRPTSCRPTPSAASPSSR